ncbi:MAG TPA: HEAT repeat domain-containing protein [Planctomycetota bacterium]|nr:HEAT repeat domain-containing protein [Planctomycetota bacterium]
MKIYFCDLCNESIPQEDLEQNRVTSVRGKMICARCAPSIAGAAGATGATGVRTVAVPAAAASGGGRLVAVVAVLLAGFGLYLGWNANGRLDRQTDPGPRLAALDKTLGDAVHQVAQLEESLRAETSARERAAAEPAKLREEIGAHLARLEGIERDVGTIRNDLANLSTDRNKIVSIDAKQGQFEQELDALQRELKDAVAKLAAAAAEPKAAAPAGGGAAPAKDPTPQLDAETKKLLADFASKEGAVRWSAVDRIARRHDPTLLQYLLPMLEDSDAFVQFRAIGAMRELNAKTSVGRLVKLLRDNDAIVREEAQDALITLTGNPMRFDVGNGPPPEREKGAKAWEEWYEKNKARFEEAPAPAAPSNG